MIRFVGIGDQIQEHVRQFAFFCTVKDKFITAPNGDQVFESIEELRGAFDQKMELDESIYSQKINQARQNKIDEDNEFLERCLSLIPKNYFDLSKNIININPIDLKFIPLTGPEEIEEFKSKWQKYIKSSPGLIISNLDDDMSITEITDDQWKGIEMHSNYQEYQKQFMNIPDTEIPTALLAALHYEKDWDILEKKYHPDKVPYQKRINLNSYSELYGVDPLNLKNYIHQAELIMEREPDWKEVYKLREFPTSDFKPYKDNELL